MKRKESDSHQQLELALMHEPEAEQERTEVPDDKPATLSPTPPAAPTDTMTDPARENEHADTTIQEARLWRDDGWTARVIRNEDGEGWAVEMTKDGEAEPALVGPWTMGRDKKSPKPLDAAAFAVLVKTASEVRRRHEQQLHALLHKSVVVSAGAATITVTLDIVPDDDHAYAMLAAYDESGDLLAQMRVAPGFKLSKASAAAWIESDFRRPD